MKFTTVWDNDATKVWQFELAVSESELSELKAMLNSKELAQAKTFLRPDLQERFISRRGYLRYLLGQHLGVDPKSLKYEVEPGGKPFLVDQSEQFSASSSGEYGLVAVCADHPIGVDIEIHNPKMASLDLHFLASEEVSILKAEQNDTANFFRIWARKESVIKATGDGLSFPLKTLSVLQDVVEFPEPARIQDLTVADGYSAAFTTLER